MALLYQVFDGLTSHQCELRLGFLRLSLAEQNIVILAQLHFFQISHLKKKGRENFSCALSRLNNQLID